MIRYLIVTLCLWCISNPLFAQKEFNLTRYDERLLHYGFQLGVQMATLGVTHSKYFAENQDSTIAIHPKVSPGFSIGFILDLALDDEFWNLRINPNATFYEHRVNFHYREDFQEETPTIFTETIESSYFQIPILIKYKSLRRHNHRVYLIAGVIPSFKVGGKKVKLDRTRLATNDLNLEITYGIGLDRYMSFFKFAPELRFSHGFVNAIARNGSSFERNIEKITSHRVSLLFNFE